MSYTKPAVSTVDDTFEARIIRLRRWARDAAYWDLADDMEAVCKAALMMRATLSAIDKRTAVGPDGDLDRYRDATAEAWAASGSALAVVAGTISGLAGPSDDCQAFN